MSKPRVYRSDVHFLSGERPDGVYWLSEITDKKAPPWDQHRVKAFDTWKEALADANEQARVQRLPG